MNPIRKPQPAKSAPQGYHMKPPSETNAGLLFRVRDRDWDNIWGEDLSWDEANKLKEQVVGAGKTKTARVEPMSVEPPEWYAQAKAEAEANASGNDDDAVAAIYVPPAPTPPRPERALDPQLQLLRQKALETSRSQAAQAQQNHQARAQARDRSSPGAAKAKAAPRQPPRPVPVVSTVAPGEDDDLGFSSSADIVGGGGDVPTKEDLDRVKATTKPAAPDPIHPKTAAVVSRAEELYDLQLPDPKAEFSKLAAGVQNYWRGQAVQSLKRDQQVAEAQARIDAQNAPVDAQNAPVEAPDLTSSESVSPESNGVSDTSPEV